MKPIRWIFLVAYRAIYERIIRRLIFRSSAQDAHLRIVRVMSKLDGSRLFCGILRFIHRITSKQQAIKVGGITLESPFILAAGLVKGAGFSTEEEALTAVETGENIIPGWKCIPGLVGMVEFGSFTRYPRVGNPGIVVWRDENTQSTQNRVGLKNPGAKAAAAFLAKHQHELPKVYGINIAVSPGVSDTKLSEKELLEALAEFIDQHVIPSWFTLNLSCPNTEDDPGGRQTESQARELCGALVTHVRERGFSTPIWVKISPDLSSEQYKILMCVFAEVGVQSVVATNTLPMPTTDDPKLAGGVGGGKLHKAALDATQILMREKIDKGYKVDVIGCGGVLDGQSYRDYRANGIHAVQYWSALIYRGPLAAAIMQHEYEYD
jgi:dihydroorotate dehydrogenase